MNAPRNIRVATAARAPCVDDYPLLAEWLDRHDARRTWHVFLLERTFAVESWVVGPKSEEVVIILRADRKGWNLYTPSRSPQVDATLKDAEKRLGLR